VDAPFEMAFLSVADIGRRADVSDSTVVRLSMALGYSGFPELRQELQGTLIERMAPLELLQQRHDGNGAIDPVAAVELEIQNLRLLQEDLSSEVLKRAVDVLLASDRILVLGLRSGFGVAHTCSHLLQQVLPSVQLLTLMGGSLPDQVNLLEHGDVLVLFSTPRYARQIVQIAEHARRVGAEVLAFTDHALSPVARVASVVVNVPIRSTSFYPSMVGSLTAVQVVVSEVTRRRQEAATARLGRLERIASEFRLFVVGNDHNTVEEHGM
jgi:DNA-binding MurR/RpiR family transcriptional regulator